MIIIFLGPPGSGKGTQAEMLAKKFGLYYFSTGDFLRDLAEKDAELDQRINQRGELVEDEEMFDLIKNFFEEKKLLTNDLILDGYPRAVRQFQLLENWLKGKKLEVDLVIFLEISDQEAIRRLSARRMDEKTGKIYNLITAPPGPGVDQEDLIQREDDQPEAIKKRLELYQDNTQPLVQLLDSKGILVKINGEQPINQIHREIVDVVEQRRR